MSPPDPNKQNDLDASLLNLCTPSALPPTFGIESSYDWTSRSGSSRARWVVIGGSILHKANHSWPVRHPLRDTATASIRIRDLPPKKLSLAQGKPYGRLSKVQWLTSCSPRSPRGDTTTGPVSPTQFNFRNSRVYKSSWPPSLFEGEGIPNTTTESTVSNDGESDSGSIVEIWDEDDASRPPFPYLDTMAIESKGKAARRNKGQVAVKRPKPEGNALVKKTENTTGQGTYEEYLKRRATEGARGVPTSGPSVASTNTQALEAMVTQLKKQADNTGTQIDEMYAPDYLTLHCRLVFTFVNGSMTHLKQVQPHSAALQPSVLKSSVPKDEGLWRGAMEGRTLFCPCDNESEVRVHWSYSQCGTEHQDTEHRHVGDIHFSTLVSPTPSISSTASLVTDFSITDLYWVCVYKKGKASSSKAKSEKYWALYEPGQCHPVYSSYVLKKRVGTTPPGWTQV
ncbi:hypothetical protein FRC12_022014 [Ceratobasidium sp. 428]|nr:hypothetical protein FRC12_022014 [Ceratobasidium sp. 428]